MELYRACSDGKVEEVQKLLQNSQININWQNQNDYLRTPFFVACQNGHIEIVKLLLNDKRVDINQADNDDGYTPTYGETTNKRWTPFHIACYNRHIEIVKLLLNDNRVDINYPNDNGETPFHSACRKGQTDIVKYMLESGKEIDINKKEYFTGKTGLDWAKENGKTDIVKLIESFQKNPIETRAQLTKELPICNFLFHF